MEKGADMYPNMLQAERVKEAGFFSNSHIIMDMEEIRDELEERLGFKVGVRYKAIFRGRKIPRVEGKRPV